MYIHPPAKAVPATTQKEGRSGEDERERKGNDGLPERQQEAERERTTTKGQHPVPRLRIRLWAVRRPVL